jgi:hypothetical protein
MTAGAVEHGVRRMCIAFDLEHYSKGSDAAQVEKQRAMVAMVRDACERGALERAQWHTQDQGDGELALLPPGIDEAWVLTALWREFREGLHRYNRHANASARLRMRVAAHEGMTYLADSGFAGTAINTVCRLRDCREVKDALREAEGDMVLIVSDRIYEDVIRGHDGLDLAASEFEETSIEMPDKSFRATAYIFSGNDGRQDAPADAAVGGGGHRAERDRQRSGTGGGTSINFGPNTTVNGVVAGGDGYSAGRDIYLDGTTHRRDRR